MVFRLAHRVLIAPVGLYKARLKKVIERSKASKVYLISEKKPEYSISNDVASELQSEMKKNGIEVVVREKADFFDLYDIYRVFTKIITLERTKEPNAGIVIDITSAAKKATLLIGSMVQLYGGITVSYVSGKEKISKKVVTERYRLEGADEGGLYEEIDLLSLGITPITIGLSDIEKRILYKTRIKEGYSSISDLIQDIKKGQNANQRIGAYKRKVVRIIHELEGRGLLKTSAVGRAKPFKLTTVGRGLIDGIMEAYSELKSKGEKVPELGPD
jgi:predicted transcriptional regulator